MPEPPARVLMTADAVGGVWTYALELAAGLSAAGSEVLVAVMGGAPTTAQSADAAKIPNARVVASSWKLEWMPEPWGEVERAGSWLLGLASEFRPSIVHLNGYVHADLPWRCPVLIAAHSDVLSWFESVRGTGADGEWDRYRRAVARGLESADIVVAPSVAMLDALTLHYGPLNRMKVIPNGLNGQGFTARAKEEFIFSAGRLWDDAKNLKALAQAANDVTWPIYCAGDAGGVGFNGVHLLGKLDRESLKSWYGRASIYALPALYEPFGYTAVEAALCGCALVLGDIPSLREIWRGSAVFVSPRDANSWKSALNALANDRPRLRTLAIAARERARSFSASRMTQLYLDAYLQAGKNYSTCGLLSSATLCDLTGIMEMPTSSAGS